MGRYHLAFALLTAAVIVAGPMHLDAVTDDGEIVIGLANNFSDYKSPCGDPLAVNFYNAAEMALEDFLAENGKYKDLIKFRKFDYGSSAVKTIEVTKEAVKSNAVALVGYPCSSYAVIAAPIAESGRVPLMTPSATIDNLTEGRRYIFRASFRDEDQAKAIANYLYKINGNRKAVVVVNEDYPYAVNLSNKFQKQFVDNGGVVVKVYHTLSTRNDYGDVVNDIKAGSQDVVFIPNHEKESSLIIKQLIMAGVVTTVAGGDGWGNLYGYIMPRFVGDHEIDAFAVSHWDVQSQSSKSRSFLDRYRTLHKAVPNDNSALAYDAVSIILEAIRKANKKDRDGIKSAIESIKSFDGVTGTISFNRGDGTPSKDVHIVKYKHGDTESIGNKPFVHIKTIIP